MGTKIDDNIQYQLIESHGGQGPKIVLIPHNLVELTPHGATTLARQLLNFAANNDEELAERYPSFVGPLSPHA